MSQNLYIRDRGIVGISRNKSYLITYFEKLILYWPEDSHTIIDHIWWFLPTLCEIVLTSDKVVLLKLYWSYQLPGNLVKKADPDSKDLE